MIRKLKKTEPKAKKDLELLAKGTEMVGEASNRNDICGAMEDFKKGLETVRRLVKVFTNREVKNLYQAVIPENIILNNKFKSGRATFEDARKFLGKILERLSKIMKHFCY